MRRIFLTLIMVLPVLSVLAQAPSGIEILYPAKVYINYGENFSVKIKDSTQQGKINVLFFSSLEEVDSAQNRMNTDYSVKIEDNVLVIEPAKENIQDVNRLINVYITLPSLNKIENEAAGLLTISGNFNINKLVIDNEGAAVIKIGKDVKLNNLVVSNDGAGIIKIFSQYPIQYAKIEVSGAGIFNAADTPIGNLDADVEGASYCSVNVTDNLVADVTGFSIFTYKGNPKYKKIDSDGLVIIYHKQ